MNSMNNMEENTMKEMNFDEMEQVNGGYWIIDGLKRKKPEPGGGSGGW